MIKKVNYLSKLTLLLALIFQVNTVFAQNNLHTDSTFIALQKIKDVKVKNDRTIAYAAELTLKKKNLSNEISNFIIKQATAEKDFNTLGKLYLDIGFSHLQLGDYSGAYTNYLQALAIYKNLDQPIPLIRAYQDMSWIQVQLTEFSNAESSIKNALKIAQDNRLPGKEAEVWNFYGIVNDSQSKFQKAIDCYKQSLVLNAKNGTESNQVSTLINLGISERRLKKYDDALATMLKAKVLIDKLKLNYYKQAVLQNLAELTFAMEEYDQAEKYILQAISNSKGNIEIVLKRGLYSNLQSIYAKKGDYKLALQYADSVSAVRELVFSKEKVGEIRNLQVKYETQLKDEKIAKQDILGMQQQQLLFINQKKLELTEAQKKNQELDFLRQQTDLENQKQLQASVIQKSKLQAKLDKQISDQQIFSQSTQLKSSNRMQLFLILLVVLALIISTLIFYNQYKTRKLNKVILLQKADLETTNSVKDRLFSIIGHDMRSPVNTLIAFNQLLDEQELTPDKSRLYANEIKKTLNQTAVLMENLLEWSRSQMQGYRPDIQTHKLAEISARVISALSAQALQKNIMLKNNITSENKISADENMTELVMRNIVSNAIKFTPNEGIIELTATQSSNETTFIVKDTGNGMDQAQIDQFNSLNTNYNAITKQGTNREKGTGLGLLLCKTFISLMNGRFSVKSESGKGSVFFITLPR